MSRYEPIMIYLDGKRMKLADVYKQYPVSDTTVRRRYKQGLRGMKLVRGENYMKVHELTKGDRIVFTYPKGTTQFHGIVAEPPHFNFHGNSYLMVQVDTELVRVDDNFDIVKV